MHSNLRIVSQAAYKVQLTARRRVRPFKFLFELIDALLWILTDEGKGKVDAFWDVGDVEFDWFSDVDEDRGGAGIAAEDRVIVGLYSFLVQEYVYGRPGSAECYVIEAPRLQSIPCDGCVLGAGDAVMPLTFQLKASEERVAVCRVH